MLRPNNSSLKYRTGADPDDPKTSGEFVIVENQEVGFIKKAKFGPGWFLKVFGTTWQNAPGARYMVERDARADWTHCRTKSVIAERVKCHLADKAKKLEP